MKKRWTAVVADDHKLIRAGLVQTLTQAGGEVVSEAANGLDAVSEAKRRKPDLMTLDIAMPYAQGIVVFGEVKRWSPATKVIIFSGITSARLLRDFEATGADGIFTKRGDYEEFEAAIPVILQGGRVVASDARAMIERARMQSDLSPRDLQIISLLVSGASRTTIAEQLGMSAKTVDNHRTSIMAKLGVHSMAELLALALREGLLDAQTQL